MAPRLLLGVKVVGALDSIVLLPLQMWWTIISNQSESLEKAEARGRVTAVRKWSLELLALSRANEDDFPTSLQIDIGNDGVGTYIELNEAACVCIDPIPPFGPERLQLGFEDGKKLIETRANEFLTKAEGLFNQELAEKGLKPCMIDALWEAGLINPARARARAMEQFALWVLRKTPDLSTGKLPDD